MAIRVDNIFSNSTILTEKIVPVIVYICVILYIKLFTDQLIYITLPPFCSSSNLRVCILRTILSLLLLLQYITTFSGFLMNKYIDSCCNIFTRLARDNTYDVVGRTRVPIVWIIGVIVSATIVNRRAHQTWI